MCPPFKASCPEQHEVTAVTVALPPVAAEHSLEERALLLQIAHLAIEKTLGGETVETAADCMREPRERVRKFLYICDLGEPVRRREQ